MSIKLLVCAATDLEMSACLPDINARHFRLGHAVTFGSLAILITGVGIPAALSSAQTACKMLLPEAVVNVGIAGAYPDCGLNIGDITVASTDVYGDIGFEMPDASTFRPLCDSEFGNAAIYHRFTLETNSPWIVSRNEKPIHRVAACTVNQCTGTNETGLLRARLFGAKIETMEGAAIAQASAAVGIPLTQIRAISNIAGNRSITRKSIDTAIEALEEYFRSVSPLI